jgi:hypothetical protein
MTNKLTAAVRFPLARIVQGDLYNPDDTDIDGKKRVYEAGHSKAGQPKWTYFFAIAVPKTRAAWWEEAWGAPILQLGQQSWPQGQWQQPTFAWKIQDGDSTTPNRKGRVNARTEGMAGCWIVNLSSSIAPKVWEVANGGFVALPQKDLVKCGYYVEVNANLQSNERASNPGLYINHEHVVYRGGGPADVISVSTPVSTLGFGTAALPAGVQVASLGGSSPTPGAAPGMPAAGTPAMPGAPAMNGTPGVPHVPAGTPAMPGAAPIGVQPNPGFIAPPVGGVNPSAMPGVGGVAAPSSPPAAPAAPSAPAAYVCPAGAPAGFRMANPQGARYDGYRANNWSDAQMIAAGHMVKL